MTDSALARRGELRVRELVEVKSGPRASSLVRELRATSTLRDASDDVEPAPESGRRVVRNDSDSSFELSPFEQSLVEAVRADDTKAAAPLYAAIKPSIEMALQRVLWNRPGDVEDLVQVTYERVLRSIKEGKFKGHSQLTTWAFSIASHVALDSLRTSAAEQRLLETLGSLARVDQPRSPERQLEARSEMERVQQILHRMNVLNARALLLHDLHERPMREVARMLGLSISAAESRLRRARMELLRRSSKRIAATHPKGNEVSTGRRVGAAGLPPSLPSVTKQR